MKLIYKPAISTGLNILELGLPMFIIAIFPKAYPYLEIMDTYYVSVILVIRYFIL